VHHPLGDALAVELGELLEQMETSNTIGPRSPSVSEF
jgi:hypothetical protein